MQKEYMLDCETLALSSRAAVWQFTIMEIPEKLQDHMEPPHITVFIPHEMLDIKFAAPVASLHFKNSGPFEASAECSRWSFDQPGTNFKDWLLQMPWAAGSRKEDIQSAIYGLCGVASAGKDGPLFWAQNAAFDFPILEWLFENFSIREPWHYRNKGCLYTMRHEAERLADQAKFKLEPPTYSGPAHDSTADCENQIRHLHYYRDAIKAAHRILAGVDHLPE